jgi:hypothetical protein
MDLAQRMISLAGLRVGVDIEVRGHRAPARGEAHRGALHPRRGTLWDRPPQGLPAASEAAAPGRPPPSDDELDGLPRDPRRRRGPAAAAQRRRDGRTDPGRGRTSPRHAARWRRRVDAGPARSGGDPLLTRPATPSYAAAGGSRRCAQTGPIGRRLGTVPSRAGSTSTEVTVQTDAITVDASLGLRCRCGPCDRRTRAIRR